MGISHNGGGANDSFRSGKRETKHFRGAGAAGKDQRTKQRLSQSELAARVQTIGVILEQDAISRIERRMRMVQDYELRAIAEVLGVTADWLMEDEEK